MTKWVILFLLVGCIYCQQALLNDPTDDVELDLEVEIPEDDENTDEDNSEEDYIAPTQIYEDAYGPMVTEHGLSFPPITDESQSADKETEENESSDILDEQEDNKMKNNNGESDIKTSLGDAATETEEEVLRDDILQKSGGAGVEQNAGEANVKQNADWASVQQSADADSTLHRRMWGRGPHHRPGYGDPHDFDHHGWHHHHGPHGPYGHPDHYGHGPY